MLFESREYVSPSVDLKIIPSVASNAGHRMITVFGYDFELLPSVLVANIPASCVLASNIICKVPRSVLPVDSQPLFLSDFVFR